MPIYRLTLLNRHEVAHQTFQFDFAKPADFTFKPGQYGGFTLIDPIKTDEGGNTRRFSIMSAPDDPFLSIAMRIQHSAFKQNLKTLPIGCEVKFAGPTGHFILHDDHNTPAVFIAGGIGITPFYSIIRDATQKQSAQKLILFYGNQTLADSAYLNELKALEAINPNFKLIAALANPPPDWDGATGYVSSELIKQHIPDLTLPIFYICGSPAMVKALHETLTKLEINETNIKVEDFPGY